jgi:hypothetical protein
MTAIAGPDWEIQRKGLVEETAMRERLIAVRDTMIVLGLQLVFRAVMLARRWNY